MPAIENTRVPSWSTRSRRPVMMARMTTPV